MFKIFLHWSRDFPLFSVSLVVDEISQLLSQSTSKSLTQGCLHALKLLSFKYPPGTFPLSWGCYFSAFESHKLVNVIWNVIVVFENARVAYVWALCCSMLIYV